MTSPEANQIKRARDARALRVFKDVVELDAEARRQSLRDLDDPELVKAVELLLAKDAESDERLGEGGGQHIIAADLLLSMVHGGETAAVTSDEPPDAIGPYRIIGVLGRGGMGIVYEGEQTAPHRRVAIKTVHSWMRSPGIAERFAFEMQALASLRHRSIPRLYDVRVVDGTTWMVMELVRGTPIDQHLAEAPRRERLDMLLEVMDGVAHAHDAGIVHRDLKPQNIIVADQQPRILDFGLAVSLDAAALGDGIVGTLGYMAPEQLEANAAVDARADVYALGVMIYEVLKGSLPVAFPERSVAAVRAAKLRAPAPRGLDEDLDAIVGKAMRVAPAERYPSVRALADDVRRALAHEPVSARAPTLLYRSKKLIQRHWTLVRAIGLTLGAIGLVVGLVALVDNIEAARRQADREARANERLSQLEARMSALDAGGHLDDADALFAFFAGMSENVGTRALHAAWLRAAEREGVRGRRPNELDALAFAYTTAVDRDGQADALRRLGRAFAEDGNYSGVDRVLTGLDALGIDDDAVARDLRYEASAIRRDFEGALSLGPDQPTAPLLRALGNATPLDHVVTLGYTIGDRLVLSDQPKRALVFYERHAEGLERVATAVTPSDVVWDRAFPRAAGDSTLVAAQLVGGDVGVWDLADMTFSPRGRFTMPDIAQLGFVPGLDLIVAGSAGGSRAITTWSPRATWTAPPEVIGPASDVDGILVDDFDGDGQDEVVVAVGAWRAYELRVLRPNADGTLSLLARRRMGVLGPMLALPRKDGPPYIVATKSNRYPSPTVLGPEHPFGEPAGVHVLEWNGKDIVPRVYLPYPSTLEADVVGSNFLTGDFDGDGLADMTLAAPDAPDEVTILWRQVAPLYFESVVIGGSGPIVTTNLDDDPADELVVRVPDTGHMGFVLGLDSPRARPLPILPYVPPPPPREPPAVADDMTREVWRRAEELFAMGLDERAAATLEQAGRLAANPYVAARFYERAGELRRARDEPQAAAALFESALAQAPTRSAMLGAARARLEAHDLGAAKAHFEHLADGDDDAAREARATLTWLTPLTAHPDPGRELLGLSEWRIAAPMGFAHALGHPGIMLDVTSDQDLLATLPVRYRGGQIALEAEVVLQHLEIGAGFEIALRASGEDAPKMLLQVRGSGGGMNITRWGGCGPWDGHIGPYTYLERPIDAPEEHLHLRLDQLPTPSGATSRCDIDDRSVDPPKTLVRRHYHGIALPPGDYELVVRARGEKAWGTATRAIARLERLTTIGLEPYERPATPLEAAHRLAFDGELAAALAAYRAWPDAAADALAAELALGDDAGALQTIAAIGEGWMGSMPGAQHLVRSQATRLAPLLSAHDRDRFARAYQRAWDVALRYLDDAGVQELLRSPAVLALDGTSFAELELLRASARMFLRADDPTRARALAERALATQSPPCSECGPAIAELELLAAAAADAEGWPDDAKRHLARWLAVAPSSESAAETLQYQPDVNGLTRYLTHAAGENGK